ncbi:uncharacterized protein [Aegilops tauschii subsp. strangulata]|uniref:uncharacterized protein n=1 Tax=Aegilops tauschii subsp. strangulata TaxID=200361 RepID=UPI00098A749A|nr:uncharacterized protein LOC109752387 [Aegilops tauschii subsp. strangulata]
MNMISPEVIKRLQMPEEELKKTGIFQRINPGRSQPKGKNTLLVMFGGELNYRTEKIVFDVVKVPFLFNGIISRPTFAKFMAASHYAYDTLKMPGPMGVITINSDKKDLVICVDKLYREAMAVESVKTKGPAKERKRQKPGKTSS